MSSQKRARYRMDYPRNEWGIAYSKPHKPLYPTLQGRGSFLTDRFVHKYYVPVKKSVFQYDRDMAGHAQFLSDRDQAAEQSVFGDFGDPGEIGRRIWIDDGYHTSSLFMDPDEEGDPIEHEYEGEPVYRWAPVADGPLRDWDDQTDLMMLEMELARKQQARKIASSEVFKRAYAKK